MATRPYIVEAVIPEPSKRGRFGWGLPTDRQMADACLEALQETYDWMKSTRKVVEEIWVGECLIHNGMVRVRLLAEARRPLEEVISANGEDLVVRKPLRGEVFVSFRHVFLVGEWGIQVAEGSFASEFLRQRDGDEAPEGVRAYLLPEALRDVRARVERLVAIDGTASADRLEAIEDQATACLRDVDLMDIDYNDLGDLAARIARDLCSIVSVEDRP
ncbi:MAG: hypothetical protein K1X53_01515 [Candidatus Sumerlaeaceae bacterium]|nr:hypothetical protein [Candidatus Sumerlaeaceae bacterium]